MKILSDFYAYKKDSRRASGEELNYYLQSKGLETVFTDKFPDFFIGSCNAAQACVYSSSTKPYDVEFEFISDKDKQKEILKAIKKKFVRSPEISLTGAAASFVKNKNNLFLYFPFYDKVKNETDVLKLRLKVNNDYSKLKEVEEVD